jgi:hypothetical protein
MYHVRVSWYVAERLFLGQPDDARASTLVGPCSISLPLISSSRSDDAEDVEPVGAATPQTRGGEGIGLP